MLRRNRAVSFAVEGLRIENSVKAENYRQLAQRLRAQATTSAPGGIGVPAVGGLSESTMEAIDQDSDRTSSQFRVGMNDDRAPLPDRVRE